MPLPGYLLLVGGVSCRCCCCRCCCNTAALTVATLLNALYSLGHNFSNAYLPSKLFGPSITKKSSNTSSVFLALTLRRTLPHAFVETVPSASFTTSSSCFIDGTLHFCLRRSLYMSSDIMLCDAAVSHSNFILHTSSTTTSVMIAGHVL